MFADDVTQIITTDKTRKTGLCNRTLNLRTQREVEKQNQYEREWKIKTNMNKFAVVPVSRRKTHELVIERRRVEYKDKARILGFKFRRSGYPRGIEDQARKASMQVTKLKRFKAANAKTRVHLYKQLVLPIMEYPPVPTHALSKSRLATLQRVQNRALRQAYNDTAYPPNYTTEELHRRAKLSPINQRLTHRANKIWEKIQGMRHPIYQDLVGREMQIREEHDYFLMSRTRLVLPPPRY